MVEARQLIDTYVCNPCREKAGHCVDIQISWKGYFYGCQHIDIEDLRKSGYFRR